MQFYVRSEEVVLMVLSVAVLQDCPCLSEPWKLSDVVVQADAAVQVLTFERVNQDGPSHPSLQTFIKHFVHCTSLLHAVSLQYLRWDSKLENLEVLSSSVQPMNSTATRFGRATCNAICATRATLFLKKNTSSTSHHQRRENTGLVVVIVIADAFMTPRTCCGVFLI